MIDDLKNKYLFFNENKVLLEELKGTVKTDDQVRTISMYGKKNRYEDLVVQNAITKFTVELLEETIQEQEQTIHEDLRNIEVKYGEEAKEMIYKHVVDRQTQRQLAYEYKNSVLQIWRKFNKWDGDDNE